MGRRKWGVSELGGPELGGSELGGPELGGLTIGNSTTSTHPLPLPASTDNAANMPSLNYLILLRLQYFQMRHLTIYWRKSAIMGVALSVPGIQICTFILAIHLLPLRPHLIRALPRGSYDFIDWREQRSSNPLHS